MKTKTDKRIDALADKIETFYGTGDVEGLMAVLNKAAIPDLLVLHFLEMGAKNHWASGYLEEALVDHFSEGGSYLTR
jgi:hypothetical protein